MLACQVARSSYNCSGIEIWLEVSSSLYFQYETLLGHFLTFNVCTIWSHLLKMLAVTLFLIKVAVVVFIS